MPDKNLTDIIKDKVDSNLIDDGGIGTIDIANNAVSLAKVSSDIRDGGFLVTFPAIGSIPYIAPLSAYIYNPLPYAIRINSCRFLHSTNTSFNFKWFDVATIKRDINIESGDDDQEIEMYTRNIVMDTAFGDGSTEGDRYHRIQISNFGGTTDINFLTVAVGYVAVI